MVVGSLPESDMEVGDQRGVDALRRLEKLFGRVQSAWTPASGMETFEIVRRRLFQPLDEDGEKARDATIQAFSKMYRDNASDFPPEAREPAYREEMRRAYPIHPEVLKRFSEDWSTLDKFQRTRGILKIMANAIYAMWRGQSTAPLITLALLPLSEDKVRTAILEPLDQLYGPILQAEVDGELSLPTRMEASTQALWRRDRCDAGGACRVPRDRSASRLRPRRPDRPRAAARLRPAGRPDFDFWRCAARALGTGRLSLSRGRPLLVFDPADAQPHRRRAGERCLQ